GAVAPEGKLFAAVVDAPAGKPERPAVRVWDPGTRKPVATLTGIHDGAAVEFSPDGKLIATFQVATEMTREKRPGGGDVQVPTMTRRVKLWEARTGKQLLVQDNAAGAFSFSPDGTLLASATTAPTGAPLP